MMYVNQLTVDTRLARISFSIDAGEVIHIIGPNGSGKSTLLSALAGMIGFEGEVSCNGADWTKLSVEEQTNVRSFLSQSERPAFNVSVVQYLALCLPKAISAESERANDAIQQLCSRLKIDDKLHCNIFELSGGEWQRVRLVGAFIQIWPTLNSGPQVLLLDEPAAPLDVGQQGLLYQLIREVAARGVTIIMANHDLNRTLHHSDKALLLNEGQMVAYDVSSNVLNGELLSEVYQTQIRKVMVEGESVLLFD